MTPQEEADFVAYVKTLQAEPDTFFIGFSVVTSVPRWQRDEYVRHIQKGYPDHAIQVLEIGWLPSRDGLLCIPDAAHADEVLSFFRFPEKEEPKP